VCLSCRTAHAVPDESYGFQRVPLLAHRLRISTRETPALTTRANARQSCFSAGHVPGLIRHCRYFVAAYIAELAPVPADDRAIAAALTHAREIFSDGTLTVRPSPDLTEQHRITRRRFVKPLQSLEFGCVAENVGRTQNPPVLSTLGVRLPLPAPQMPFCFERPAGVPESVL